MVRGRPAIRTRKEIVDHFDRLMVEKGLDKEEPPKGGVLFMFYMQAPKDQRLPANRLAKQFKMSRSRMGTFIERWDENLQ